MRVPGTRPLLVITKEDLDRKPVVTADLETVGQVVQRLDLVLRELPAVQLEVLLNALLVDGLGDDTPALLQTPQKQNLLGSLALLLRQRQEGLVLVQRRVGRSQARVTCAVDALLLVIGDQLGRWVIGVQLNLVDRRNDLGARVVQELLQVLDSEVGDTDVLDLAGSRELLHLLPVLVLMP